jgi:hypothetical protein
MLRILTGITMRQRKLITTVGLGLLVAVGSAVPAMAQPSSSAAPSPPYPNACSSVDPKNSESAHEIYRAGKVYYDDANYSVAILKFREAYKLDCTKHELLIIISRAYELNKDTAAAIDALEKYLERAPNAPDAHTQKSHVDGLKKTLAQAAAAAAASASVSASANPPPPVEVREHTIPPWIVVGAGGAAIILGTVLLAARPDSGCDASSGKCVRRPNESNEDLAGRQADAGREKAWGIAGPITIVGGVVIAAGGLLWHFVESTGPVEKTGVVKPTVTPAVAPGYAGMSLGGTF